jgi:TetR/AcrR family transcriptional regulator, lmrAB and yxaGH operons repressor
MAKHARERLITSTIELMRRDGVAATGISELVAHSGVARRSIYLNFPGGKEELVAAATRAAGRTIGTLVAASTASDEPAATLASFVGWWKATLTTSNYTLGCPVAAGALASDSAPSAPAEAAAAFRAWEEHLVAQLMAHNFAESVARSLATMAVCAIEGAVIQCVCMNTVEPLDAVQRHLTELLEAHRRA